VECLSKFSARALDGTGIRRVKVTQFQVYAFIENLL
jgi:hypothetical protein